MYILRRLRRINNFKPKMIFFHISKLAAFRLWRCAVAVGWIFYLSHKSRPLHRACIMTPLAHFDTENGDTVSMTVFHIQCINFFFLPWRDTPQWARVSSLSDMHDHTQLYTPQSVGFPWTSDQPDAETSTWRTHNRQISIRTCNPSKRVAADPRSSPPALWERLVH
jgi:hypothetical protein